MKTIDTDEHLEMNLVELNKLNKGNREGAIFLKSFT